MTVEQFNTVLHAQPFRPFTIQMGDGQSFRVEHRDFVSRSPTGRTVTVYQSDDSLSILDLLLMTEIQVDPPTKAVTAA